MMDGPSGNPIELTHRTRRVAYMDIPGAGQVYVDGDYAYIGQLPNKQHLGTTIIDIKDPRNPKIISTITLDDHGSHSHKARVIGDIMIVNHERNMTSMGRRAEELPAARARLTERLGRAPDASDLATELGVSDADIAEIEKAEAEGYDRGGFKVYDVSDRAHPREIAYQKTGGIGVHRFDMDENYAYISTEMEGYVGNILVNYDISDPSKPEEVSRWWMPGQHIAGGEVPDWKGRRNRLHHALRVDDKMWAGVWHGGVRVIDIADIKNPKTIGSYNYHPPFPEPSHTFMGLPFQLDGRDIAIAIDEEDQYYSAADAAARRGRPHANLWVFDVTDMDDLKPLSIFQVSEADSPWSQTPGTRFGAHQFQEHMKDTLVYCTWFSGGLRIVDIADPSSPREVGWYIPEPAAGRRAPQSNDVDVDDRGLVYLVDRFGGLDIIEFDR